MKYNYRTILDNTIPQIAGLDTIIDYWPSSYEVCLRLTKFILDIIPDPYGGEPSMLHRCLIMGVNRWTSSTEEIDIKRFKVFNDGLVKPLTELLDYRIVSEFNLTWDPFKESLQEFCEINGEPRVIKMEYRSDERFVVNQRFLSFLMAGRILSMNDVIAFQALPNHSLLSFS